MQYPRLFRQTWKFTAASFLLSAVTALMAYSTVQQSPQIVADILGGGADREFCGAKTVGDIRERFGHEGNPFLSSFVITNNIRVALAAFALGITFGVGTIYMLVVQRRHGGRTLPGLLPRAASAGNSGW